MSFPKSARRNALETLYRIWQQDPVLSANVKTWQLWRTKDDYGDLDVNQCPWVRITPRAMPSQFGDTSTLFSPIKLEIETAMKGWDVMSMADFWGALEAPISSRSVANYALLNAVGIEIITPTLPAISVTNKEGGLLLVAKGEMVVTFYEQL